MDVSSEIFEACISGHNVLVLGQAGTGKTALLQKIRMALLKRGRSVSCTATTGNLSTKLLWRIPKKNHCNVISSKLFGWVEWEVQICINWRNDWINCNLLPATLHPNFFILGIAASLLPRGRTVHSWVGLGDGRYTAQQIISRLLKEDDHREVKTNIRSTDVLIIDEVWIYNFTGGII